jgi:diaminopropionate ammonia-lyase
MKSVFFNTAAKKTIESVPDAPDPRAFHSRLPAYEQTPLRSAPAAARRLAAARVWVKDESSRLGLPAFKVLGASWAAYRLIEERLGISLDSWETIDDLKTLCGNLADVTFVTATDGNHGRAVARVAAWFGVRSRIFIPAGSVPERIEAIESEGAAVTVVDGGYDAAVAAAAALQGPNEWLIQDTGWPGYEKVPAWIVEGYATMFLELEEQLAAAGSIDIVAVQIGVGSLAAAVVLFSRRGARAGAPMIVGVEPHDAACARESARARRIVTIPGPHETVMAGLNCGTVSSVAWPHLSAGVDIFVTVSNERAFEAMRLLARDGVVSGESGAAGLAGLIELAEAARAGDTEGPIPLSPERKVLVIVTEGITDAALYREIVPDAG